MSHQCEGWTRWRGVCNNYVKDADRTCRFHRWQEDALDAMSPYQIAVLRGEDGTIAVMSDG